MFRRLATFGYTRLVAAATVVSLVESRCAATVGADTHTETRTIKPLLDCRSATHYQKYSMWLPVKIKVLQKCFILQVTTVYPQNMFNVLKCFGSFLKRFYRASA